VDALRQLGDAPKPELHQLWRRMVFNVLVSNNDDHLRNHGFIRGRDGWRLAPAFDMNPTPIDVGGRMHVLALNELDHGGSLDTALSVHAYFALSKAEATTIAGEVGQAVSTWKSVAKSCLPRSTTTI
jgi:serine/threonine-protein kinase HipA